MAFTTRSPEIIRLTGICQESAESIRKLENAVADLKARLSELEEGDPYGLKSDDEEKPRTALGRRPKKSRGQMEVNRDQILSFVSPRWIEIEEILADATAANDVQKALFERYIASELISHPGLDILFNNAGSLFLFIKDGSRYRGDAVEVASAMAGVPDMAPRSSYDYFLAKKNRSKFDAQQLGAMKVRSKRISKGKRREPRLTEHNKEMHD
jgi:hypothetical protein